MNRTAKANMEPVRQRTQFTCVPASLAMCLRALGHDVTEDIVNKVMGAAPMKGARWEEVLAAAQHFGCRATLTMPATVEQLKAWTDAGVPVMIAWNPEGRDWSHASAVFDVEERDGGLWVHVADPNMPNPKKTVRVVSEDEFYDKWYEKMPNYLVRRPAVAIEREVTPEGAQVRVASMGYAYHFSVLGKGTTPPWEMSKELKRLIQRLRWKNVEIHDEAWKDENGEQPMVRLASDDLDALWGETFIEARAKGRGKNKPKSMKDRMKVDTTVPKQRSAPARALAERGNSGGGKHKNKKDFERGHARKPKHKKDWRERSAHVNWRAWVKATPGAEDPDGPIVAALADLEQLVRMEGLEATQPKDALKMAVWDWGWSGHKLPTNRRHWAYVLAKVFRVDIRKEHAAGLEAGQEDRVTNRYGGTSKPYSGNPDGKPIYPVPVDHGDTEEPLAAGHDIMRRVQNKLLEEQGQKPRPRSPEASVRLKADSRQRAANRVAAEWLGESE